MKYFKLTCLLICLFLVSGCASVGAKNARQKTATVVNLTVGAPFYVTSYVSGLMLNVVSYGTAWIWGEPAVNEDVPLWFSADYGPNYASMNSPWCWLYAGAEPENRALLLEWPERSHVRSSMGLFSLEHEWPPAFAFCRTNVGIRKNKRGDESYPVGIITLEQWD
jgi:hypothetical protein